MNSNSRFQLTDEAIVIGEWEAKELLLVTVSWNLMHMTPVAIFSKLQINKDSVTLPKGQC